MNRRAFIRSSVMTASALAISPTSVRAAETSACVRWPIGCFNRPWVNEPKGWTIDTALDGIKAAGFTLAGLISRTAQEPLIGADATPRYLAELKEKLATRGLKANLGALRFNPQVPLEDQIQDVRRQIDNGRTVGLEFLITFGADKPEHFANFFKLMADGAAYAQERGLRLVLKPHGGISGTAEEIQRCLDAVKHPNFQIWYDAGNIIYYTGKDPVEQLKPIAQHVTGFCAKDCDKERGAVMLEFGKGKVDFAAVFGELKRAGFNGPVMVECCAPGDTPELVTAGARKNREFLEQALGTM